MTNLYPIVLAGGAGTRLWPLSRQNFPKQFLKLKGERSLLQETLERLDGLNAASPLLLTNEAHYFLCQEQISSEYKATYLLEPLARNTAPALSCAAHYLRQKVGPEALLLIMPSDHWIADKAAWQGKVKIASQFAATNKAIITFGIKPKRPETGYGYIKAGAPLTTKADIRPVLTFCEKPNAAKAQSFIDDGDYYWNSGMFLCRADVYLEELQRYAPEIYDYSEKAFLYALEQHDFVKLEVDAFSQCPKESIDYAVMEKSTKAALIPLELEWSDLGCWNAVADAHCQDESGNTVVGKALLKDSENCLIKSDELLVTTLGIRNQIIIATRDAVLVADKSYTQHIKELVETLGPEHHHLTQDHLRVSRPWGFYEVLIEGLGFKVKRLMVKPSAKLSLQMHAHRAEHWVVVGGRAEVVNKEKVMHLSVNQSTYIPPNTLHRLSNPGPEPLYVIEVQSGIYLGEDDIQRFDDLYARVTTPVTLE